MTDEITIIYKCEEGNNIRLFGDKFIENNKNKCKMIMKGKKQKLKDLYFCKKINKKQKKNKTTKKK